MAMCIAALDQGILHLLSYTYESSTLDRPNIAAHELESPKSLGMKPIQKII